MCFGSPLAEAKHELVSTGRQVTNVDSHVARNRNKVLTMHSQRTRERIVYFLNERGGCATLICKACLARRRQNLPYIPTCAS
mmetsp:Transcript_69836/g.175951  ORF Transcript_69836/g.175951 Transcript_69836/m.175951 type:complete len:82 (-) Transcript_69836:1215-1460(-)